MRGRKPTELSVIRGGLERAPGSPSWLTKEAKSEWRRIVPQLVKRRILTDTDMATVTAYCAAVGDVQRAQEALNAQGEYLVDGNGKPLRNPAWQTKFQALTELRRLAAELGLTPASRHKAGVRPETEGYDDPYSDLGV